MRDAIASGPFRLFSTERLVALPRYQTPGATLDWAYDLMSELEKVISPGRATFIGFFRLHARLIVAGDGILIPTTRKTGTSR
jgi:predicted ATPase